MATHGLCLNDEKSELLIVGSPNNLQKLSPNYTNIIIDGNTIPVTKNVKTLGFYLDANVNLTKQINATASATAYTGKLIRACAGVRRRNDGGSAESEDAARADEYRVALHEMMFFSGPEARWIRNQTLIMLQDEWRNQSSVKEFFIVGLSEGLDPSYSLFLVFLVVYLITAVGNLTIIGLITIDQHLHSPMYFFLANLALIDIIFSSITVPRLLDNFVASRKTISFAGCITQLYFFQYFVVAECYLLAVMAYDRYVAICFPLNYSISMNRRVRIQLVAGCWICGLVNSLIQAVSVLELDFCGPNVVNHFFCDATPLFKLSCSDTRLAEAIFLTAVVLAGVFPLTFILVSYVHIILAILKVRSSQGRWKTFSTCASHFTVVALYYGSGIFSYIWPSSTLAMNNDVKVVAVLYTVFTPMLNPIIYSFRNREVKAAMKRVICRNLNFN
ncbi:olfactory receptor 1f45-like [Ambystoma mexicanum]|uniref:olfactory receptor 1f45-like n=1 Tax=Ambystoma mexicanum TaxID=8296 RepID=UPI0037E79004